MHRLRRSFVILALTVTTFLPLHAAIPPQEWHLALGNPSDAAASPRQPSNYLMEKRYYALSYNRDRGTANWVSWHLSTDYLGNAPRASFRTDTTLPSGFRRVTTNDYRNSGFDRGHLCPHGDRALDNEMSISTFLMTNMIPQAHENNAGVWEALERYGRSLAGNGKDLFIVAGPLGRGGTGLNGARETIADGAVTVPSHVFKVLLVVDRNERARRPLDLVDRNARLIAVVMPNDRSVPVSDTNWARFRTTVAQVEERTGYNFFRQVPAEIMGRKKQVVDDVAIPRQPPRRF